MEEIEMDKIKRYEVTVERQYIVYAGDVDLASQKALTAAGFRKPPEVDGPLPVKVISVIEIALEDEPRSEIIDVPPRAR